MSEFTPKYYTNGMHLNDLLEFSSEQLNDAYSRMDFDNQPWIKGTSRELDYLISVAGIPFGSTILDVGCGQGRHSIEAAKRGFQVTGIDASESNIVKAQRKSAGLDVSFLVWDARKRLPGKAFDCVMCLYDVIGSYRNLDDNVRIIRSIALKLHKGGIAMVSVIVLILNLCTDALILLLGSPKMTVSVHFLCLFYIFSAKKFGNLKINTYLCAHCI